MSGRCPLCEGTFSEKSVSIPDVETLEEFRLHFCRRCGVGRTLPVPDDLSPYYSTGLGQEYVGRQNRVHQALKNVLLRWELARVRRAARGTILDVGCGCGDFAALLRASGFEVACADAGDEPALVREAGIPYHRIDYETYEIDGFCPDKNVTVVLRHVLEHVKEPAKFLRKLAGDYGARSFYIAVPNSASIKNALLGRYDFHLDPPRHLWHFSKKSLFALLETEGLRAVEHGYDTLPTLVPSLYRFLKLRRFPAAVYGPFRPRRALATISIPLEFLAPTDVIWVRAEKR